MHTFTFQIDPEHQGERLDRFLSHQQGSSPQLQGFSRTRLQQLIRQGCVHVGNQVITKPNFRLDGSEKVRIEIPALISMEVEPEPIALNILYQDEHLAVVDKPAGLVVHPHGNKVTGTLVNALLHHLQDLSGIGGKRRPGIVHRLDKGTSGLLIVAKNDVAHQRLTECFKQRRVEKTYLALVQGHMKESKGTIEFSLTRHRTRRHKVAAVTRSLHEDNNSHGNRNIRTAITRYQLQKAWCSCGLLSVYPETGRTHQIRVHLSQLGHPVLGDATYGYRWQKNQHIPKALIHSLDGLALHAWKLKFPHPHTEQLVSFEAVVPQRIQNIVDYLDASIDNKYEKGI